MNIHNLCRLCQNSSELRESHIIPKCIFKLIRDESLGHRFIELRDKTRQITQKTPKEYLLCDSCERRISKYEKYFKEAIHLRRHGVNITCNGQFIIFQNINYKEMKLFFLSLLWRMSVSSLPEFQIVNVGNNEDIIREMIRCENPGKSVEFSVSALIPLINNKRFEEWAVTPGEYKNSEGTFYLIIIGGILYLISSAFQNRTLSKELILNDSGVWIMPLIDISNISSLWEFICQR